MDSWLGLAPFVGVSLVCAFAAGVGLVTRRLARARLLREADRAWPRDAADGLGEGTRRLRGVLVADGAVAAFDGNHADLAVAGVELGGARGARTAEGLALRVDGERVPIEGAVTLVVGSREARSGTRLWNHGHATEAAVRAALDGSTEDSEAEDSEAEDSEAEDSEAEASEAEASKEEESSETESSKVDDAAKPRFSSLRPGDRVVAVGWVVRTRDAGKDYRHGEGGWRLVGEVDGPVALRFDGAPAVDAPAMWRTAMVSAIALGLGFSGLSVLGAQAVENLTDIRYEMPPRHVDPDPPALRWAALSPWHRDAAAQWLEDSLAAAAPQSLAVARRRVEVAEVQGCAHAFEVAGEHRLDDEAIAIAARCPSVAASTAYCREGRFEEAARSLDASLGLERGMQARLLVGDLGGAASAVEARVAFEREMGFRDETRPDARTLLAEALRARAGDEEAKARLRAGADGSSVARLLLADLAQGEERARLAAGLWDAEPGLRSLRREHALALLASVEPAQAAERLARDFPIMLEPAPTPFWTSSVPRPGLREALAALDASHLETPDARMLRAFLSLTRASELLTQAREAEARALLDAIEADLARAADATPFDAAAEAVDPDDPRSENPSPVGQLRASLVHHRAVLLIQEGDPERARQVAATGPAWVARRIADAETHREYNVLTWHPGIKTQADLLATDPMSPPTIDRIRDPWPLRRIEDRDGLAAHFRYAASYTRPGCDPTELLTEAVREVRVARALYDDAWLTEADARIRRYDEALSRPEVGLVSFLLANGYALTEPETISSSD